MQSCDSRDEISGAWTLGTLGTCPGALCAVIFHQYGQYLVCYTSGMKDTTSFEHFEALDIRVGKITNVEDAQTKKPTYRITVDFGPEIGTKVSCGAYRNYAKDELIGKQVVAVINLGIKQMGPEKSEILILGVQNEHGQTVYLTPQAEVALGAHIF